MAARNLELALRIRADLDEVKRELRALRGGVDKTTEGMARMQRRASGLTEGLTRAAVALASFAAGARAVRNVAAFEASISKIVGLVGLSRAEVEGMGEALLALAPKVAAGPGELAEALFFVTSAGARGAQALKILELSAKAATAGLGDTATVADAVTSAINAYGKANLDAGRATGILVAAVREGKAGAETIAPALGKLLPIAVELGVGFDEVAGSVAFFTRSGLNAAEAATALRGLLVQILRPTQEASKAAGKLGVDFTALRKTLRERGLLAALDSAIGDNREAFARLFPDIEGLTGLLSLLGKDAATARDILESLAEAGAHTVDAAFGAGAQDTLRRYETALATLDVVAIRLGADALPVLAKALQSATEHLGLLSGAVAFFLTLRFAPAVVAAASSLQAMALAARGATGAMLAFSVALRANPIGLVATVIGLAAGALVEYATAAEEEATPAQDAYNRALEAGRERLREEKEALEGTAEAHRDAAAAIERETLARLANERALISGHLQRQRETLARRTAELRGAGYAGDELKMALGGDPIAATSRAAVAQIEDRLALLDAAIGAARDSLRSLETPLIDDDDDDGGGDGGGGSAVTKAAAVAERIKRIHAQAEETIARLTLGRFALIERETAAHVAELEALKGAEGADEAKRQAAIEAAIRAGQERQEALLLEQHAHREALAQEEARIEAEKAGRIKAAHLEAVDEIESALATPYERAIAEINRWREEVLKNLDRAAEGHEAYAERVAEVNAVVDERLAKATAQHEKDVLDSSRRWQDGVRRALRTIANEAGDSASFMEDATLRAFSSMEDALVEFVTTGKLDFSDMVDHIIADLARIAIRKSITEPLAEGLEGVLGDILGLFSGTAPLSVGSGLPPFAAGVGHAGAIAGQLGGRRRAVAPALFAHAPRFHQGGIAGQLRPNERPVIMEKGEGVFTAEQMRALGGLASPKIEFNLISQGTPQRETGHEMRFDTDRLIVNVLTDDLANGGPISQAQERAWGLRRSV